MISRRRFQYCIGLIGAAALLAFGFAGTGPAQAGDPVKFPDSQLEPLKFSEIDGWAEDDHAAAFAAFMTSCKAILRGSKAQREARPVFGALYEACQKAVAAKPRDAREARAFFEQNFRPVRISPLSDPEGFLTGYYEPIADGTREKRDEFSFPLYRKPAGLLSGGRMLKAASFGKHQTKLKKAKQAKKAKRAGKHRLVQFFDRSAIDDSGVLAGRDLEICYLKDPVDAFFIHIQGSARVRLEDGKMLRVNYAAQNGHPYTAVGKFLIERKLITKEEMSMDRIREWMNANPEEAKDLRRKNKSYVFFRETNLADNEEAVGAQGVSLTPLRSIAVDRNLHVYGTPFFISARLPIESEQPTTPFRRLMIAQDTGGAIVGVARADIYYGAGDEAGRISGRFKHPGKFVMLFPNEIDPVAAYADAPLPTPKPAIPAAALAKKSEPAADKPKASDKTQDKAADKAKDKKAVDAKKPDKAPQIKKPHGKPAKGAKQKT